MERKLNLVLLLVFLIFNASPHIVISDEAKEASDTAGSAPASGATKSGGAPGAAASGKAPGAAASGEAPEAAASGKAPSAADSGGAPGPAASGGAAGPSASGGAGGSIDITTLGAKPGSDCAQALTKAWEQACASTAASKIVVPKGNFSLTMVELKGPCKGPITIEMAGNFEAPTSIDAWKGKTDTTWVKIEGVSSLTIVAKEGGGVFDGNGEEGWKKNDCKQTGTCNSLPYNFRFCSVNDSILDGITSLDSKQFHMNLIGCFNMTIQKVKVIAPKESLNTDGIHIGRSQGIKIIDTTIGTGDDCISIGDGTKNLTVTGVTCGPGHGLSIGSLGLYDKEEPVSGISVSKCTFKNTDNGIRIKSWLKSKPCTASDMHFEDITMDNVTFPLLIDQAYCPSGKCDATAPSQVKLSNIFFKNVKGTAADPSVLRLVCSTGNPCDNVHLEDIDLKYSGDLGPAVSECCNVKPVVAGTVNPKPCSVSTTEAEAASHVTAGTKFAQQNAQQNKKAT